MDEQADLERQLMKQRELQQSYMSHWRVKMNPQAGPKSVVPLPIEGKLYS